MPTNPLQYIVQAAMGNCSTLPDKPHGHRHHSNHMQKQNGTPSRSSSRNSHTTHPSIHGRGMTESRNDSYRSSNSGGPSDAVMEEVEAPKTISRHQDQRARSRSRSRSLRRPDPPIEVPPPAGSEKQRCYRLNLEWPSAPSIDKASGQSIFGPLVYEPPLHHLPQPRIKSLHSGMSALQMSDFEDEEPKSETEISITTALIFRGITVDKRGNILSQNARASRSAKKSGESGRNKKSEKSRQVAKINKAASLVDEIVKGTATAVDGEAPKMSSLFVVGEYDDMKYLVKDGAKKLRDATNMPDEALFSINRQRNSHHAASISSSRKRVSPYPSEERNMAGNRAPSRSRSDRSSSAKQQQSPTPKIKSNPRDSRSGSSRSRNSSPPDEDTENGGHYGSSSGPTQYDFPPALRSDFAIEIGSKLGSLWNCGGAVLSDSTMSPNNHASPKHGSNMQNAFRTNSAGASMAKEGRNEHYGSREYGVSERV